MMEEDRYEEGVRVLHRMIAYVRDEALRLNITDVALLLQHAQEAVVAFAPTILADHRISSVDGRGQSLCDH